MTSTAVFLGAGASLLGGVPLAGRLFDEQPLVDRITRRELIDRVLGEWRSWQQTHAGGPEQYLASLQLYGGRRWLDAQWYVSLVIALKMGILEPVGAELTITRHNVDRTTGIPPLEAFWSELFTATTPVAVLTTNYDVLAERGMRTSPRSRIPRPGFHYGSGPEPLAGGGYPSYSHIRRIGVTGHVPLLKLHGSVSWAQKGHQVVKYHDCRPAIRGDALIVAPVPGKRRPSALADVWSGAESALKNASLWLIVGYSLPEYDHQVRDLFRQCATDRTIIRLLNPDPLAATRFQQLLPRTRISLHPGLPEGTQLIPSLLCAA